MYMNKELQLQIQQIQEAKFRIQQFDSSGKINTCAISNNLQYIVSGQDKQLKLWMYNTNQLYKQFNLNDSILGSQFTEDSQLLYVGTYQTLYQFQVKNNFKQLCRLNNPFGYCNIHCISNTMILTTFDSNIIKTDVNLKKKLFKINAHIQQVCALDYNKKLNIIASGSFDKSIKLWNAQVSLIIEKQNAHYGQQINQLFFIKNNQLISQGINNFIIWKINYRRKKLEQLLQIHESGHISLILNQQFIVAVGIQYLKIYTIMGDVIRQVNHDIDQDNLGNKTIQLDSKAILKKGQCTNQILDKLKVFQLEID